MAGNRIAATVGGRLVAASSISLVLPFGQVSLIPLRLLSPPQPLSLGCGGVPRGRKQKRSPRNIRGDLDKKQRAYIMPSMPGMAGMAGAGSGLSATRDSVVSTRAETEAAFCRAERVTFAGSMMPATSISQYSSM